MLTNHLCGSCKYRCAAKYRLTSTLLAAVVGLFISAHVVAENKAAIIVLGDSISAAYGLQEDDGWVALLQEKLEKNHYNFTTINASITGETTSGGTARIDRLLDRHRPHTVILELGGNDGLRGLSLQAMRRNLERIIQTSRAAGAQVLLLGMRIPPNYGANYANAFHQIYHDLAAKHRTAFVPFLLEDVALNPALMQGDGIHPATEAQPLMLRRVWVTLEPLLK